jgi:hypothetical protein
MTTGPSEAAIGAAQRAPEHAGRGWLPAVKRCVDNLASRPLVVLAVFTAVYLPVTIWLAAHKLFWDDEFFTLYISAGKWPAILDALRTGADQHPPSFYFLTHLITSLLGATHVTVRATSILGFWLMSVCLYALGRKYLAPAWSVVLLLLPCATGPYYWYASDARGYSLMSGFAAAALLCWVKATLGEMRPITIPALFISLAGCVACHYYGIFVVGPLALGEAVRCAQTRKLDFPLWAALSGAFLPPLLFLDLIKTATGYSKHFWAKPRWLAVFSAYPHDAFIVFALLVGAAFAFSKLRSSVPPRPVTLPFATAIISLALLPSAILVVARVVTHTYHDRYTLVSGIGLLSSICFALARFTSERTSAAATLVILEVLFFGMQLGYMNWSFEEEAALARIEYRFLSREAGERGLLAIPEVTVFHRLSFYAPISFARRISYLADADREIRYLYFDTIDRGLLALRPWFPINTQPYERYLREHDQFLVYGNEGPWTWLTYELPKIGAMVLRRRIGSRTLFDYTREGEVPPYVPPNPSGDQTTMLDRLPDETGSVCRALLIPSSCPDLR